MSAYPEHDKLHAVVDKSQAIGEFLEWLRAPEEYDGKGAHLHVWKEWEEDDLCAFYSSGLGSCDGRGKIGFGRNKENCPKCGGTGLVPRSREGWVPLGIPTTKLLAEFFEIDLNKLEDEKQAILDAQRELNRKAGV